MLAHSVCYWEDWYIPRALTFSTLCFDKKIPDTKKVSGIFGNVVKNGWFF